MWRSVSLPIAKYETLNIIIKPLKIKTLKYPKRTQIDNKRLIIKIYNN